MSGLAAGLPRCRRGGGDRRVGGREQHARVEAEQASVAAEVVREQVVGVAPAASRGRGSQADERELPFHVCGLSWERFGRLGDSHVDADATPLGLGAETRERVFGALDRDCDVASVGTANGGGLVRRSNASTPS